MNTPRIEVDLGKIRDNTRYLVGKLKPRGISVTGVTKAVCGNPAVANAMLDGGARGLADSRISNIERMRKAGLACAITMLRTPIPSQAEQTVRSCETSYNTEISVMRMLGAAARKSNRIHNVILMVEMGDMREGILPENLQACVREVLGIKGVALKGIGANFACLRGMVPNTVTMAELSELANDTEVICGHRMKTVSGGNSANLQWAFEPNRGNRINDIRLGESILLGVDPVTGEHISGLHIDAFTLLADVIETKAKSSSALSAQVKSTNSTIHLVPDHFHDERSILAIGHQDTDISGLSMPHHLKFQGATSDHMVLAAATSELCVGAEVKLQMNYSALMRAMSAPDITKVMLGESVNTPP